MTKVAEWLFRNDCFLIRGFGFHVAPFSAAHMRLSSADKRDTLPVLHHPSVQAPLPSTPSVVVWLWGVRQAHRSAGTTNGQDTETLAMHSERCRDATFRCLSVQSTGDVLLLGAVAVRLWPGQSRAAWLALHGLLHGTMGRVQRRIRSMAQQSQRQ